MAPRSQRSLRRLARPVRTAARKLRQRSAPPTAADQQRAAVLEQSAALVEARRYDDAERMLDRAIAGDPDEVTLLAARARLEGRRGDWAAARDRWAALVATRADDLNAAGWVSAVHSHRRARDIDAAEALATEALERYAHRRIVLWEAAHVAMARADWDQAVVRWVRYWRAAARDNPDPRPLPRRASQADWFEAAWHEVVNHLDSADALLDRPAGPYFHRALARVLAKSSMDEDRIRVLERGARLYPDDAAVVYELAAARLESGTTPGSLPVSADEIAAVRGALPSYTATGTGLGPIRLVRVPRHSSLELALRSGHYVDRPAVGRLVQEISERDRWPEPLSPTNILLAGARKWADDFGARFASPPHLTAETLSDAVMVNVYHESALFVPMQRLADELAARAAGEPVLIEVLGTDLGYLEGYASGDFDLVFLYFALLERGANAFLVRIESESVGRATETVRFVPKWRSVMAALDVVEDPAPHARAIVPAGIRRVVPLVEELDDVVVYQSGSVVKEFAYDRSIEQQYPIHATARLHPEEDVLPTFAYPLTRVARLTGRDLGAGGGNAKGSVEVGEPLGGTWPEWLHRATSPLLEHLARTAAADIERRGVTEAHIGDHLYAESVIVGDIVRRAGGRVIVWPHSTNPVHVDLRRAESFDEVHAVTHGGAEAWRRAFPDKVVHHSADSMLSLSPPRPFEPGKPVSLVIFGGRSTLGNMPTLDTAAHRELYVRFFAELESLQASYPVDVFFKPRGLTGEHEHWLFQTVGKTAGWRPIYQHSLRLELPNMVFASVSMGTSALIEGLTRGIPGFVVREFPVRDYTTLDAEAFPIIPATEAMELLAKATTADGYDELVARELHHMKDELGL